MPGARGSVAVADDARSQHASRDRVDDIPGIEEPLGRGAGVGRVKYGELNLVCHMEKAIPILMKYCATGKHIDEAKLEACKATGNNKLETYFTITLTKAYVSSCNFGGHDNSKPTVNLSMTAEKIKTEYKPQKSDGSLDSAVDATYDIKAGQAS